MEDLNPLFYSTPTRIAEPQPFQTESQPNKSNINIPILKSDIVTTAPTIVQPKPTIVQTEPTIVQTKPTIVQPKPTIVQTIPTIVQTEPTTSIPILAKIASLDTSMKPAALNTNDMKYSCNNAGRVEKASVSENTEPLDDHNKNVETIEEVVDEINMSVNESFEGYEEGKYEGIHKKEVNIK